MAGRPAQRQGGAGGHRPQGKRATRLRCRARRAATAEAGCRPAAATGGAGRATAYPRAAGQPGRGTGSVQASGRTGAAAATAGLRTAAPVTATGSTTGPGPGRAPVSPPAGADARSAELPSTGRPALPPCRPAGVAPLRAARRSRRCPVGPTARAIRSGHRPGVAGHRASPGSAGHGPTVVGSAGAPYPGFGPTVVGSAGAPYPGFGPTVAGSAGAPYPGSRPTVAGSAGAPYPGFGPTVVGSAGAPYPGFGPTVVGSAGAPGDRHRVPAAGLLRAVAGSRHPARSAGSRIRVTAPCPAPSGTALPAGAHEGASGGSTRCRRPPSPASDRGRVGT
jgi:hypothetical protein